MYVAYLVRHTAEPAHVAFNITLSVWGAGWRPAETSIQALAVLIPLFAVRRRSRILISIHNPSMVSMMKVANSTKWVMPSMALVSPSLRLMAATMRVMTTITVCTGVMAMTNGCPV